MDLRNMMEEVLDRKLGELLTELSASFGDEIERLSEEKSALAQELELVRAQQSAACGEHSVHGPVTEAVKTRPSSGDQSLGDAERGEKLEDSEQLASSRAELNRTTSAAQLQNEAADHEDSYEGLYDLTRAFRSLCSRRENFICAGDIVSMQAGQEGVYRFDDSLEGVPERYRGAIQALNLELGITSGDEIYLDTFIMIMQRKEHKLVADKDMCLALSEIRDILVREDAYRNIAKATNIKTDWLYKSSALMLVPNRMDTLLQYVDPIIGLVIILNAVVIFISTDVEPTSEVWTWLEVTFTVVFFGELIIKLGGQGCGRFFEGHDRYWNIFDCIVVVIAALDLLFLLLGSLVTLRNFTIVRLLRFARLTKLVRVLKLKMFKELTLMVNGIIAGFRVLVWAIVFLGFILFSLGVVLTQTIGQESTDLWPSYCEKLDGVYAERRCSSAQHLQQHHKELFGNVFRSMFTVFRCFTDGCSSVDGTPLVPYFYNLYGTSIVMIYMVVMLFVIFGLFNLIMAIFVENTIDNAKRNEVRRRQAKHREHLRVAQKLQQLIILLCTGEAAGQTGEMDSMASTGISEGSKDVNGRWEAFKDYLRRFLTTRNVRDSDPGQPTPDDTVEAQSGSARAGSANLSLQVTQAAFEKMLQKQEVQVLLDELDITVASRPALFEIMDANCNGTVEVTELVEGLLKLRGTEHKADVVASLLAIRSMQKNIKALEVLSLHQQHVIAGIAAKQQRMGAALDGNPHFKAAKLRAAATAAAAGGARRSAWNLKSRATRIDLQVLHDSEGNSEASSKPGPVALH